MAAKLRLHYFDTRGRAELARLMLKLAKRDFEDCRYTGEKWQEFKPRTPFGQMPCLEVDGTVYAQSGAIFNYLARELGLYGSNNIDALNIDVVIGLINDFVPILVKVFFLEKDEEKKKELTAKLFSEDAPKFFKNLEKLAQDTGLFVGKSLTLADLAVFDMIDSIYQHNNAILTGFPKLAKNRQVVESNPNIAAYLKERK